MRKLIKLSLMIGIAALVLYFIPGALNLLSFSGEKFFAGEIWRILTFHLVHVNKFHLIENLITFTIIILLGNEIGVSHEEFILCFLGCGIIIALASSLIMPTMMIAGLSLGIYALLGAIAIRGSVFIPKYILIPVFILSIFIKFFFTGMSGPAEEFASVIFHLTGFIAGIGITILIASVKKKRRFLQWKE